MFLECPNCRESVSFLRAIRTPAWGSFRCKACGSILAISFARRLLGAGVWLVGLVLVSKLLFHPYAWGRTVAYAGMSVTFVAVLYLFEKVVLLDRRAFTCKQCGYDLQGLTEARCPECGTAFDPAERERILARIASPPPKPKYRRLAALVVVLLVLAVVAGMAVWRRASATATKRVAAPTTQPGPSTSPGGA
jgi:hypothetical protein